MMDVLRTFTILVAVFLLGPTLLDGQRIPPGCRPIQTAGAPAIGQVLDLPLVESALADIALLRAAVGDSVLVGIRYDSMGALLPPVVSHPQLEDADAEGIRESFLRHAARVGPASTTAYGLIARGTPPRLSGLTPRYGCDPVLTNRNEIERALRSRPQTHGAWAVVHAYVKADGSIGETRLERSLGSVPADSAFLDVARLLKFQPALLKGYPWPVWVSVPIQSEMRRRLRW